MSFPASPLSPLSPSSCAASFLVTGKALQLHLSRPLPQLPTRKFYNPAYFFNETYQHEVANHYRDYKQRSRIPRRRRHTIYVPYRRAAFYGVVSGEQRPVLPIAVHDFPRFTAVYTTPRGRQTLCEDAPPDDTYNATVRRIRQANDYKELKVLVERQLKWSANRKSAVTSSSSSSKRAKVWQSKRWQKSIAGEGFSSRKAVKWATAGERKCENSSKLQTNTPADVNVDITNDNGKWHNSTADDEDTDSNANDSVEKVKANAGQLTHCKQEGEGRQAFNQITLRTKKALSKIQGSAWNEGTQRKAREALCSRATSVARTSDSHNKKEQQLSKEDRTLLNSPAHFLQLASDYYEQGFLRHINYLQAVGKRNAARREQLKRTSPQQANNSSNDEPASAATSATNTSANTPRLRSAEHFFRLTYLLRHIGRKRSFNIGIGEKKPQSVSKTASGKSDFRQRHNSCAIRVKIKPSATQATHYQTTNAATQSTAIKGTATTLDGGCSMNDYLNANSPTTISSTTNTVAYNATSTVATRAHFNELIDHLMQLEISEIDASLPKITLTDCSTIDNNSVDETAAVVGANKITRATVTTHTNDNAFAFEFNTIYNSSNNFSAYNALHSHVNNQQKEQQQQSEQQHVLSSAHYNGFTLRETKFGGSTLHSSLELPDEVYYNSEARPP